VLAAGAAIVAAVLIQRDDAVDEVLGQNFGAVLGFRLIEVVQVERIF